MSLTDLPPGGDRRDRPEACLSFQPGPHSFFANASRIRTTPEGLDQLVAAARRWFGERGRADFMWFLGPSSTPNNLQALLRQRGAVLESVDTALLLTHEPTPAPAVEVRPVRRFEEFVAFRILMLQESGDTVTPSLRAPSPQGTRKLGRTVMPPRVSG